MEVVVYTDENCLIMDVSGEVDMYCAPEFYQLYQDYVRQHPPYPVLVNISNVTYMDSSGIGVLFKMFAESRARSVQFFVCGARGMVASLFELSKMNSILPRSETVQSAQKIIRSIA